jgi:hypothetical protein
MSLLAELITFLAVSRKMSLLRSETISWSSAAVANARVLFLC